MKWITRERPKIDRVACPWLVKRFIDPAAEFVYVPKEQVFRQASLLEAIPYDIPGAEYSHYGEECSFDYFIKKHGINDPALLQIAMIVRAADTDRFDLAPQAAGLWAISAGLSQNFTNDHQMLEIGMKIYDALYSWACFAQDEKHNWNPLLLKSITNNT
ncbi:chromate resistance protein ChrB domain-containing protein [Foetidibacter luteolus]|uniref:chromate resistance protein ChrB domain-containing protein n=1 Tax=Foetidibacter luteolus TaxID=2608880 RepID=UPI00129AB2B0|nr:chromate resistance protein ChrB domain-containing protein [Foetidibacter luteolus]